MNLKYYANWKDFHDNDNRLELWVNRTVSAKEVTVKEFSINYESIDLLSDNCLYGCGADFSLISEGKLDFLNELFTVNVKGIKVIHYFNNLVNYQGWLNIQQYTDNYSEAVNYPVSTTSNNGIAILDKFKISDNNNDNLDGIYRAIDVLKYAVNKIGLDYDNIYVGASTSVSGMSGKETILHKLYVNAANYIDEKGNWMSCREVINAILLPLTLRMYITGSDIYIIDINTLAGGNRTLKKYNYNTLNYINSLSRNDVIHIDEKLGNFSLSVADTVNKATVKFNKYVYDVPYSFELSGDVFSNLISETERTNKDDDIFIEKVYQNCSFIDKVDNCVEFVSIQDTSDADDIDYFLRMKGNIQDQKVEVKPSLKLHTGIFPISSRNYIKFNASVMVEDRSSFNKEYVMEGGYFLFLIRFRLGDKIFIQNAIFGKKWETVWNSSQSKKGAPFNNFRVNDVNTRSVPLAHFTINKYYDIEQSANGYSTQAIFANLNNDEAKTDQDESIPGNQELIIELLAFDPIGVYDFDSEYWGLDKDLRVRIKDLKVTLLNKDEFGNLDEITSNDVEFQGTTSNEYVDDISIDTKHGTDEDGNSRGLFLVSLGGSYSDSDYATNERLVNAAEFTRGNLSGTTEELMLNTYLSNLRENRYLFNCSLLGYYSPLNLFVNTELVKSDSTIPNLLPVKFNVDYLNAATELQLLEIVKDE